MSKAVICVGGGPASFFAAIHAKKKHPDNKVTILEATRHVLTKVKISGGGRCNVTHNLFDLKRFASCYPRGSKEILGALHRFGPEDTMQWFSQRGVDLHAEADGRMFPTTNQSSTIINCLRRESETLGVEVRTGALVKAIQKTQDNNYILSLRDQELICQSLFLGTGSMPTGHRFARQLGHTITELAPSLFTFCIEDPLLKDLSGLAFEGVALRLETAPSTSFEQTGPLLITHWGLSGPAVLKLSAFAARDLNTCGHKATLFVDFIPGQSNQQIRDELIAQKKINAKKLLANINPVAVPLRFWKQVVSLAAAPETTWAHLTREQLEAIVTILKACPLSVQGKGEFKEEFVTCGGVKLSEINFKTMESKINPGLFFAGEILDIDGITGGFNFQNAWTGGFIAGEGM